MKPAVKKGDRVELLFINDTWTHLKKGDQGIVTGVEDDAGDTLLWVNWDNGEKLALIVGIDKYKVIRD